MAESEKLIKNETEAIECLKSNKPTSGYLMLQEAIDMAIQALEKQIPKKPQNKKYSFYPRSTLLKSKYGECPNCKSIQVDDEYCANCGQKLDWSDEE